MVAKGYAKAYGIDYEEVFIPIVRMAAMRVIIAMANKRILLHQICEECFLA